MAGMLALLLATTNRGKLAELSTLLADLEVELAPLTTILPGRPQTTEDGETFRANALLKGRAAASEAIMVTLAEDAGLEVDALGGRPGVRSARFAREGATDAENNETLLKALEEVEEQHRRARFRSAIVLVDPWGQNDAREIVVEGLCEGWIARSPRGTGGFGYDSLFVVDGFSRTMAELSDAEKSHTSHRAKAVALLKPSLKRLIALRSELVHRVARSC
jgi:XTP/dITP diphosphohydrolase